MSQVRNDWTIEEVQELLQKPLNDLVFEAQTVHRQHFNPNEVQVSTLLSIKTGACPEDCKYCPQSAHYHRHRRPSRRGRLETPLRHRGRRGVRLLCTRRPLRVRDVQPLDFDRPWAFALQVLRVCSEKETDGDTMRPEQEMACRQLVLHV